ncbi:hypothetical protein HUR95_16405 [Caldalkalibacillus thermarum TA2.A1]|uniref:Uncharacterized protein n=1 Tax=Caldalkalibacillus thermarum (strain TA2.A1) TaxID=986075 RepID=A0A8X8L743_CALTT|nr:hypothetical protein [Caldalkalibacillus thermarum]QZT33772.1 hypothetical protein HUR95_16405 [Caldalkalibacillus thermarum TA2.A1]
MPGVVQQATSKRERRKWREMLRKELERLGVKMRKRKGMLGRQLPGPSHTGSDGASSLFCYDSPFTR